MITGFNESQAEHLESIRKKGKSWIKKYQRLGAKIAAAVVEEEEEEEEEDEQEEQEERKLSTHLALAS